MGWEGGLGRVKACQVVGEGCMHTGAVPQQMRLIGAAWTSIVCDRCRGWCAGRRRCDPLVSEHARGEPRSVRG